jgi:tetratricopeptide (TPR) repeat protein
VAALTAAAALPALADNKPPSERDRQLASDLVKKAIARSQAGDHAAAIKIYLQAYTLVPNSLLLSNIGAEFQQDGLYKEALDYFCKYLEQDPAGTNAPYARSQAKILQRQLGRKRSDGGDVCAAGKTDDPSGDPPARSERPAAGDRDADRDDKRDADRDDKRPDKRDKPRERTAQRGRGDDGSGGEPVDAPPAAPSGNPTLMYTGIAAGVAGLAAGFYGIYAGVQGKQISDQISSHDPTTPWPGNIRDLQNRGDAYNRLQVISFIGSGVLVTTGVVLFVLSRPDAPERTDKPTVSVAPTTNGLAVFGRF